MVSATRSSKRIAANNDNSSSPQSAKGASGTKRKADASETSTQPSKGRKGAKKEQKTLEETIDNGEEQKTAEAEEDQPKDIEMKEAASGGEGAEAEPKPQQDEQASNGAGKDDFKRDPGCWFWLDKETYKSKEKDQQAKEQTNPTEGPDFKTGAAFEGENKEGESKDDPEKALKDSRGGGGFNTIDAKGPSYDENVHDEIHAAEGTEPQRADADKDAPRADAEDGKTERKSSSNGDGAVEESQERAKAQPSNVLEKGIIYFFTRGRVGIEEPESVTDLQRSYMVLRPLPPGGELGDGAIDDVGNNRLIALPKKVWPKSPRDRFMVFVEGTKKSMADLKDSFFKGSDYDTKTQGTRHTPTVTPIGEGVYAMVSTGSGRQETHLAYMLTIPQEPGELQDDVGLRAKGSFVMSLKNPEAGGPSYANLPQGAEFPKEVMDEFRGRGWMPPEPKHFDYQNAQILLIGESLDDSKALEANPKDEKNDSKETPAEEVEKLEHEDELRVEHLKGDDTVFDDLHLSSKEYPSVPTTW